MSERQKEMEEKPRLELVETKQLYTVGLCNPIKEKVNQIQVCRPNIEITPCSPIERVRCLPDLWCGPLVWCLPDTWCQPRIWCNPIVGPCLPVVGPQCGPWVQGGCGPAVEIPIDRIDDIAIRVERLTAEIESLKKRVSR